MGSTSIVIRHNKKAQRSFNGATTPSDSPKGSLRKTEIVCKGKSQRESVAVSSAAQMQGLFGMPSTSTGRRALRTSSSALEFLEWSLLLTGAATLNRRSRPHIFITILESQRLDIIWGRLLLFASSFAVRKLRTGRVIKKSGLELPIALFLSGVTVSTLLSKERRRILPKSCRILSALSFYYAVIDSDERVLKRVAAGMVVAGVAYAVQWPTGWNFQANPAYLAPIQHIGCWINRNLSPLPGLRLAKNRAASLIAPVLPFAVALGWHYWSARELKIPRGSVLYATLTVIMASGLLLTFSRGAWLGVAGATSMFALAAIQRRWPAERILFWRATVGLAVMTLIGLTTAGQLGPLLSRIPDSTGSLRSRWQLVQDGRDLIRDYCYTGIALENVSLTHAVYCLQVHVPFQAHLHNVYLGTWLEDGVLGAAGLLSGCAVCALWIWRSLAAAEASPLGTAGLASLIVIGINNLVQDIFTHGTLGDFHVSDWKRQRVPLLAGVLLGLAGGFARRAVPSHDLDDRFTSLSATAAGMFLLAFAAIFHRRLWGAWQANRGALAQTQVELNAYDPDQFDRPTLDQIRQRADLRFAQKKFREALNWDPTNATALQRLSAIALSRGRYDEASTLMRTAWNAGHRDRVTRLLLGDVLVAEGALKQAAQIVKEVSFAEPRLMFQAFYRYWTNKDFRRTAQTCQTVLLLNPSNKEAHSLLEQVKQRIA